MGLEMKGFGFVVVFEWVGRMLFIRLIEMGNMFNMNRGMRLVEEELRRFGYIFIDEWCWKDMVGVKKRMDSFLERVEVKVWMDGKRRVLKIRCGVLMIE